MEQGDVPAASAPGADALDEAVARARADVRGLLADARARAAQCQAQALARVRPEQRSAAPGPGTPAVPPQGAGDLRWQPPVPRAHSRPDVIPVRSLLWSREDADQPVDPPVPQLRSSGS